MSIFDLHVDLTFKLHLKNDFQIESFRVVLEWNDRKNIYHIAKWKLKPVPHQAHTQFFLQATQFFWSGL